MCQTTYTTFGMRTRPIAKCRVDEIFLIHKTAREVHVLVISRLAMSLEHNALSLSWSWSARA